MGIDLATWGMLLSLSENGVASLARAEFVSNFLFFRALSQY